MKVLLLGLVLALLVPAYADEYVDMKLTGNDLYKWAGEYVSPYQAMVGGQTFLVSCLDLTVNTYIGQWYKYDVTTPATGDNTSLQDYQAAAVLAQRILTATGPERGRLSFAIWDIFNDAAVQAKFSNDQADLTAILGYKTWARGVVEGGSIPSFRVFYPDPDGTPGVPTKLASQRFIQIVPEPFELLTLLLGVLGVGLFSRRRRTAA